MPKTLPRFFSLIGAGLLLSLLSSSCVQRTVTHTEQSISFSDAWRSQTGDIQEIKEKFASGFEIKDGRPVATRDRVGDLSGKEFEIQRFDGTEYRDGARESNLASEEFNRERSRFSALPFVGRDDVAAEQRQTASESGDDAGFARRFFRTGRSREASSDPYPVQGSSSRDDALRFGSEGQASREATHGERVDAQVTLSNPFGSGDGSAPMTVDEVRKLLHPGDS